MIRYDVAVVCDGRAVDDQLRPTGERCGKEFKPWPLSSRRSLASLIDGARAAGWSVAPDGTAMCAACRKPPKEITDLVREVRRG